MSNAAAIDVEVMDGAQTQALMRNQTAGEIETASRAVATRTEAEVKAMYALAQLRPRDIDTVRVDLLRACKRSRFAETARYSIPRGGKKVEGPSIRFAEEAMRAMGNLYVSFSIVHEDEDVRIIRGRCVDLERNTPYEDELIVRKTMLRREVKRGQRVISQKTNSSGQTVYLVEADDSELVVIQNAAKSKLRRNLILQALPSDLLEEAMDEAIATLRAKDASDPAAARKKIVDSFAELNVFPAQLKEFLECELTQISPQQLSDLRGIYQAIKEGATTWKEITAKDDSEGTGATVSALADKVAAKRAEKSKVTPTSAAATTIATTATTKDSAPPASANIDALRARALMADQDAIDELQSMGQQIGVLEDVNVDKLPKELGERYRAWLVGPKK